MAVSMSPAWSVRRGEDVVLDGAGAVETPEVGRDAMASASSSSPSGDSDLTMPAAKASWRRDLPGHGSDLAGQIVTPGIQAGFSFASSVLGRWKAER